jgi:hypothetical protein
MLDARCSMLDARCSMLDARCSMLDARCSMLDARCSMLDARCSMLDATKWSIRSVNCQGLGGRKSEIRNPKSRPGGRIEYPVSRIEYRPGA